VKEIKEPVLPPLDDDLARAASEFDKLDDLRSEIEERLRAQIEADVNEAFRRAALDKLVDASDVSVSGPLVEARTRALLESFDDMLRQRGGSLETYLQMSGSRPEELVGRFRSEAQRSVAGELVLEAAADKLGIQVSDDEIREELRTAGETDEDIEEFVEQGGADRVRDDIRLKKALDRIAAEVKPIAPELHDAREAIWTPEKDQPAETPKLWTPGNKE
jgi:trigger factor